MSYLVYTTITGTALSVYYLIYTLLIFIFTFTLINTLVNAFYIRLSTTPTAPSYINIFIYYKMFVLKEFLLYENILYILYCVFYIFMDACT